MESQKNHVYCQDGTEPNRIETSAGSDPRKSSPVREFKSFGVSIIDNWLDGSSIVFLKDCEDTLQVQVGSSSILNPKLKLSSAVRGHGT
ncbi:hypothetical protein NC651_025554 [Populus alba x Populus x berolinensis]|nr:hypothetical protein NC651_025554 [Populus alba x Populus x berolinensis]